MDHYDYDQTLIPIINNVIDIGKNIYNFPLNIKNDELQKNYNILKSSKNNIIRIGQRYNIETDTLIYVFMVFKNDKFYQVLYNNNTNAVVYISQLL